MFPFRKKKTWYQKVTKYFNLIQDIKILFLMIAVIMIWRGVWNLLDHFLFPENYVVSSIISIIIGVIVLFLNDNDLSRLDDNGED